MASTLETRLWTTVGRFPKSFEIGLRDEAVQSFLVFGDRLRLLLLLLLLDIICVELGDGLETSSQAFIALTEI
jgi:hypothetical protein